MRRNCVWACSSDRCCRRSSGTRCCALAPLGLADRRNELLIQGCRRDRPDVLVDDFAATADDEAFGHAVDAPLDRGTTVAIDPDGSEGITVAAEEAACERRLVLVVDAVNAHPRAFLERQQQWVLLDAGHAPGGPE